MMLTLGLCGGVLITLGALIGTGVWSYRRAVLRVTRGLGR